MRSPLLIELRYENFLEIWHIEEGDIVLKKYISLFIKRNEQDVVALVTFFTAFLGISIISMYLKTTGTDWYWIITFNILFLLIMRVVEILLTFLISKWNRKANYGFYVIAALAVVLINTFIL
jgi:hypothetical protein